MKEREIKRAKSISPHDIALVKVALVRGLGTDRMPSSMQSSSFLTGDGWQISIGGWHHGRDGWSRGFSVRDAGVAAMRIEPNTRGYVSPRPNAVRYTDQGWRFRMVEDIEETVRKLRNANELLCPVCGTMVKWAMSREAESGSAECQNGLGVSRRFGETEAPCFWGGGRIVRTTATGVAWDDDEPEPAEDSARRKSWDDHLRMAAEYRQKHPEPVQGGTP